MSTPETDELLDEILRGPGSSMIAPRIPEKLIRHAKRLEVERNEARQRLASAQEALHLDWLAHEVHKAARANGWWETRERIIEVCDAIPNLGEAAKAQVRIAAFGLVTSEAGEAMDNVRTGMGPDDKLPEYPGAAVETADTIIRCLDLAGWEKWPIGEIVQKKLAKNRQRGRMHGGKIA